MCVGTEWLVHYVAFQIGPDMLCGFAQCSTLTLHEAPYQSLLEGPSLSMQHMALHPTKPNISLLFQGLSWGSMISPKKLIRMARKWQKVAALGRKRISLQRINRGVDADSCSTSTVADKGHFVVYSSDRRRFAIPLAYLNSEIFRELFQMSEEEFGIQSAGPIILPCDSVFMDYVISFIQRGVAKDLERALIMSIAPSSCSSSSYFHQEQNNESLLLCAF
ncbi:hypothetical protein AAG906_002926 [Vitis piasezkii]